MYERLSTRLDFNLGSGHGIKETNALSTLYGINIVHSVTNLYPLLVIHDSIITKMKKLFQRDLRIEYKFIKDL